MARVVIPDSMFPELVELYNTEGKIAVKSVDARIFIHGMQFGQQFVSHSRTSKPRFISIVYGHKKDSFHKKNAPGSALSISDNSLLTGRKHLAFAEGTNPVSIPGETIQHHSDTIFSEEICNIFKKDI